MYVKDPEQLGFATPCADKKNENIKAFGNNVRNGRKTTYP